MGGNFYGGHIAFAMDGLKAALASVADMCDRQIMLLVNPNLNRGLPGDLVRLNGGQDRSASRLQGHVDFFIGAGRRGAQSDNARRVFFAFDRIAQSGQGQHGHHRRPRCRKGLHLTGAGGVHSSAGGGAGLRYPAKYPVRPLLAKALQNIRQVSDPVIEDRPLDEDIERMCVVIRYTDFFRGKS